MSPPRYVTKWIDGRLALVAEPAPPVMETLRGEQRSFPESIDAFRREVNAGLERQERIPVWRPEQPSPVHPTRKNGEQVFPTGGRSSDNANLDRVRFRPFSEHLPARPFRGLAAAGEHLPGCADDRDGGDWRDPHLHFVPRRHGRVRVEENPDALPVPGAVPAPLRRRLAFLQGAMRCIQDPLQAECGRRRLGPSVSVVMNQEGRWRFENVAHCGSVWACLRCRANICCKRAKEITAAVERHGRRRVAMLTLTLRHGYGDDLALLRSGIAEAWGLFTSGAPWQRFCRAMGIVGFVRALECTHGEEHGFHPHLHILVFLDTPIAAEECVDTTDDEGRELERWAPRRRLRCANEWIDPMDPWKRCLCCGGTGEEPQVWSRVTDDDGVEQLPAVLDGVRECGRCQGSGRIPRTKRCNGNGCAACDRTGLVGAYQWIVRRWQGAVERALGGAHTPDDTHGVMLSPIHAVDYIAKLGLEVADPGTKEGRRPGHRTPLEVAADFVAGTRRDGRRWSPATKRDAGIWRAYRLGMKGARQLCWSHGLKKSLGIREREDQHLCQDDEPHRTDVLASLVDGQAWDSACRLSVTVDRENPETGEVRAVEMPARIYLLETGELEGAAAFNREVLRLACGEVPNTKEHTWISEPEPPPPR